MKKLDIKFELLKNNGHAQTSRIDKEAIRKDELLRVEIHKIREELIEKVEGRYSQMVNQMKQVEAHQKT